MAAEDESAYELVETVKFSDDAVRAFVDHEAVKGYVLPVCRLTSTSATKDAVNAHEELTAKLDVIG